MRSNMKVIWILLLAAFILGGCNLGVQPPKEPTPDLAAIQTQAIETISVTLTLGALGQLQSQPTATEKPTIFLPTATQQPTATLEPLVIIPTETIGIPTATLESTPTPQTDVPMLHVTTATNCRAGPNPTYGVEGYITTDMKLPVRGINVGHSWWWVDNPTYPGYHCWVWRFTSVVEGDVSAVPVYFDPWTPTPGIPNMDVSITRWTGDQTGKCPISVIAAAVIRTDKGGQVRYEWLRKGRIRDKGWVTIAADGSAVLSFSFSTDDSDSGSIQLKIVYPTHIESNRVFYTVKCRSK